MDGKYDEDDLSAARGFLNGFLLATAIWSLLVWVIYTIS